METLRQKQSRFVRLVGLLIEFAYQNGFELTFGDAYRDPRYYGHPNSNHGRRLAIDLNLFKDGQYLKETEAHRPLGAFWESLGDDCVWGGEWGDGNHYSILHEGQK